MSANPSSSFSASSTSWPEGLAPHVAALLEGIRQAAYPPIHQLPVEQARKVYETSVDVMSLPAVEMARVEDLTLSDAAAQPMRARLWAPTAASGLPVLLYLHGGGFVVGGIATCENMCRRIAALSGAAVVAVEYRLAPEHRFPAAVDDAVAWYRELLRQGVAPENLVVSGDSAGGGLTLACLLAARDQGLPMPAGALLFSKLLIEEAGVAVAPGVGFGEYGEGFVRVGLVENEHRIRQAARNVKKFLANADEILARAHNSLAAQ